jgi:hypothetical protein
LILPVLTYLVVLAVNTPHIAIAEEYRSRPTCSRNSRLFPMMGTGY